MVALFLSLFFGFTPRREGPKDGHFRKGGLAHCGRQGSLERRIQV